MATAQELREHLQDASTGKTEALKAVLNAYFEYSFIKAHKPFRAVIGNKKCKPIPIHRDFGGSRNIYALVTTTSSGTKVNDVFTGLSFEWPAVSEEMLRKELGNLGFVLTEHQISIFVPPYKKGTPMSFAQEWVKKINASYAEYCDSEKKEAKRLYKQFLGELMAAPYTIQLDEEHFLYPDFEFSQTISRQCYKFIKRLMAADGIDSYYEGKKYKGVMVKTSV